MPSAAAAVPATAPGEPLILDLPGARCLRTGLDLAAARGLWPVVTFGHWYDPHGLVGDAASAALLLLRAPAPAPATPAAPAAPAASAGWCLLLDHERYRDAPLAPDRCNNQYDLTEDDLPAADELRRPGLTGACLVTADPPGEDLCPYAAYLAVAGLTVRWHQP